MIQKIKDIVIFDEKQYEKEMKIIKKLTDAPNDQKYYKKKHISVKDTCCDKKTIRLVLRKHLMSRYQGQLVIIPEYYRILKDLQIKNKE